MLVTVKVLSVPESEDIFIISEAKNRNNHLLVFSQAMYAYATLFT
jgi:hypothetical protein